MASSFFSRHSRTPSSQQQTPVAPTEESAQPNTHQRLRDQLTVWQDDLLRRTRIDGADAPRLTIGAPHPGGLAKLYADQPTRLSLLIREPSALKRGLDHARAIMARSSELTARHGVGTVHMSIGYARWMNAGEWASSAVLLRPVLLEDQPDDVTIRLASGYKLDNTITSALLKSGVAVDAEALIDEATSIHGFSSSKALAKVRELGRHLDQFELRDELIIGLFEHPASQLHREYDNAEHILSSDIVRALAGDQEARQNTHRVLPDSVPTDRDPWKERGAGDLTPQQQDVVEAVASGRSFVVDVPHGSDDTALVGAILADSAAYGRRVIHLGGSPSRTTMAEERLRSLGLSEAGVRLDGTTADGSEIRARIHQVMTDTSPVADMGEVDEIRTKLRDVRSRLSSYTTYLHRPFRAFGASAYEALQVLTDLTSEHPSPSTRVRFREDVLLDIAQDQGAKARELLHEASNLGLFARATAHTAWKGVVISSDEQVPDVLLRVHRLATESLPELRVRISTIAGEADIRTATTLSQWLAQLHMFEGVRDVLDIFTPQIFENSAADMVIATASKQWRAAHGITMKRSERTRLLKRAQDFVRPGTHVSDLHAELLKVQERRDVWRDHTGGDGWPTLPNRMNEAIELTTSIQDDLKALRPMFLTGHKNFEEMTIVDLAALFESLDTDPEGARELPRRVTVLKKLKGAGLASLAEDLRDRHVDDEMVDSELDLAWWASILGLMLASDPQLGGFDPAHLEATLESGRALDLAQVNTLAPQVLGQLRRLRLQAMATRPDQQEQLEALLASGTPVGALDFYNALPLVRHLVPVVFTVPTLVPAIVKAGHHVDLLILDDIDDLPLVELIPIIARARQVVVLADLSGAHEGGAARVLASVLPTTRMDVAPTRLNDQVALLLARHGIDHTGVPVPWTAAAAPITAFWCESSGMPAPGSHAVESTTAEVDAVVEQVIEHAVSQPERSLGVIALSTTHANRIQRAIEKVRASEPGLASFFDEATAQPFAVVDPGGARGFSRDRIIISVGFAKTPHGRVIHDFGVFSSQNGLSAMSDVLRAVRGDLTLISSIHSGDIDPSRLSAEGAQMLYNLIEIGEGQSGVGNGGWPVLEAEPDRLLIDLAERLYSMGLEVVPNVGIPGGMRIPLAIGHPEVPGRLLVAVLTDDEAYVAEPSLRVRDRMWPAMLEAQGWKVHTALSMAVFIDPAKEANTIVQLVLDAVDEINGVPDQQVVEVPMVVDVDTSGPDTLVGLNAPEVASSDAGPAVAPAPVLAPSEQVVLEPEVQIVLEEPAESGGVGAQTDDVVTEPAKSDHQMDARERADEVITGMLEIIVANQPETARGPRPAIAPGLPLAAYSDDQLDEMAMWIRSDGVDRSFNELIDELRDALGITRRGFQSDAVLGNVVRRTRPAAPDEQ